MSTPEHVWFDLDGTLVTQSSEFHLAHDALRYETFTEATDRARTPELEEEYESLYKQHGSNSAVFRSLDLPSDYWSLRAQTLEPADFFKPDEAIYGTLGKLATMVPISLFTNSKPGSTADKLKVINVDQALFTHIITGDDVKERKPALEGFRRMVELSERPAGQLLFVGDRVDVDIKPAKAVGMQTCLMWDSSPEADYSFLDFKDLLGIFS